MKYSYTANQIMKRGDASWLLVMYVCCVFEINKETFLFNFTFWDFICIKDGKKSDLASKIEDKMLIYLHFWRSQLH